MFTPSLQAADKRILGYTTFICAIFLAWAALLLALYLQHALGESPCALCMLQRYAYIGIALVLLLGGVKPLRQLAVLATIPLSLAGAGVALYHLWGLAHPTVKCGRDTLEIWLNNLVTAKWLPEVFLASGFCFDNPQPLFGLSLPLWSLIGMLTLLILSTASHMLSKS